MKKFFKILGIGFGSLFVAGILWGLLTHESVPVGKKGPEADELAKKMLKALDYERYKDTRYLHWSYRAGANQYQWDRQKGICNVKWDDYRVQLEFSDLKKSRVSVNSLPVSGTTKEELVDKALHMFNNDSFWLVAPYKVFDKGTQRSIVALDDGTKGLLVTYTSGGSTPGDSYLWLLDADGKPYAFKMWVKIIPIGGLQTSWGEWITTSSGAQLPKLHKLGPFNLSMGKVKGFNQ